MQKFNSYRAAKDALGTQPGTQIHHIVEQCQAQANRSGFPISQINSTDNLVRLPENVHQEISKFYSFKTPDGVFRDTLNGLSFEEQSAIGMDIVQRALNGTLRK